MNAEALGTMWAAGVLVGVAIGLSTVGTPAPELVAAFVLAYCACIFWTYRSLTTRHRS